jgi:hypothetical protein
MPQWIAREYLARRGSAKFNRSQVSPARCPLLGFALNTMQVEGSQIPIGFLQVENQPEVGVQGYEAGAKILTDFFNKTLEDFMVPDLDPVGRKIIDCCRQNGTAKDYEDILGPKYLMF